MKRILVIIGCFCLTHLANAQSDSLATYIDMSFEDLLKVKITTAGKQEQEVKDIPASVVVITRADIEAHGYQNITEILRNISGMYMTNDYGLDACNFGVRGYWSVIPNNNLMIFVNDVDQVTLPYSMYSLNDIIVPVEAIERIEVIRGPMSVLYGSGAFFGVINIFTREVNQMNTLNNMVSSSVGTQQTGKAMLRVSKSMPDFSYSLNISANKTNGINQPYNKMTYNTSGFKTETTKDLLKQQELYFGFNAKMKKFYTDVTYTQSNSGLMFIFPSAGEGSFGDIKTTRMAVGYKNSFAVIGEVDYKLSYYSQFRKATYDAFFRDAYEYQDVPSNGWDADLTINTKLVDQLHLTTGAKFRSILNVENNLHLPTNGFGFFYNTTQTIDENDNIDSWAAFTQLEYKPFEKLKIIAGGRLEQRFDFTLKTIIADTLFGVAAHIMREKYDQQEVQFIPRLALIYELNTNHIIKFLYGKAINTPSWFQIMNGGPHNLDLMSQNIQSYELNYIVSPFSMLLVSTSVFYNKMDDLIVRTLGINDQGQFYNYNSNAGKVETRGIELTAQIKPIENLTFEVNGTFQKSVDMDNKDIDYNYSPQMLGNLKMTYYFGSHLYTSLIANYVDKMETNWLENNDGSGTRIGEQVPAYYTIGANIRAVDLFNRGIYLELHGNNILDEDIRFPATTNNNTLFPRGTLDFGRQILFTLGYKFKL